MINWKKRNYIAEVAFLGVKEHIILLFVADFTLPYSVHFLLLIYFHSICSFVVGLFKREYNYRLIASLFLSDN